jgi:RNA polymerase sigma factor (sigma-70 family)
MSNDENEPYSTRDTLLARIINRHDEQSWEEFVFYYQQFIYIICRQMKLQHHDAEEVVQKVLLKIWNKFPEIKHDRKKRFRGWLCQVTGNTVKDYFRKLNRQKKYQEQASEEEHLATVNSITTPEIEIIAEAEWENYIANLALKNITPKFSEKVIDIFRQLSEGQTAKDLGEKLGIPANTISVYKKRVISKLHEEIRRLCAELD